VLEQDHRDQRELDQHRQDAEGDIVQNGRDRAGAALEIAADGPALTPQVIAQREPMQMVEHLGRETAHRAIAHPREDHVAQLVEERGAELERTVGDQERQGQDKHLVRRRFEGIDDIAQHQGHTDVGHLRRDQTGQRQERTPAELPEVGQHPAEVVPVTSIGVDGLGRGDSVHASLLSVKRGNHVGRLSSEMSSISVRRGLKFNIF
jgi:hypothetical protein